MNIFSRSQLIFLAILVFLLLSLPLAIFLTTQKQHDIRPRAALTGAVNLLLNSSNTRPVAGDVFEVLVSAQITNENLRISGADFKVLYSNGLLEAVAVTPAVGADKPFTDVIINEKEICYDDKLNFVRVSEISRRSDSELAGGVVQLARIKFRAKNSGNATIKFPDNNSELQIVGIDLSGTVSPTSIAITLPPTSPPYKCPAGSTCTPSNSCRPASRIVAGGNCPENQICCAPVEPTPTLAPTRTPTPTIACTQRPFCLDDVTTPCRPTIPPGGWCEVTPTLAPTLTLAPPTCVPRPPCADGAPNEAGDIVYCDPAPGVVWCPKLTSTPTPTSSYCCRRKSIYDESSFNCASLTDRGACTSMALTQICEWVCQ